MSDYGLNFGFLRSDESSRSAAEGRFKTPVGSALVLGTLVEIDPENEGFIKQSDSGASIVTGYRGLLLQELDFDRSIYQSGPGAVDSFMKGVAQANRLSVITSGPGTKVWFKNTSQVQRLDGRVVNGRTMFTLSGLAVGDQLGWDGSKWAEAADGDLTVTAIYAETNRVEAVLNA